MRSQRLHAFLCAAAIAVSGAAFEARAQKETVRPEVGKPLQDAQNMMKSGRTREALAKVTEAENVGNKTPTETLLVQRMKGAVATAAGDLDTANRAYEAVLNSGRVSGKDAQQMVQAIAVNHYKAKDYSKAAQWTQRYFKEGGGDPKMRTMLLQSYFLGNDCPAVNKMLAGNDRASEEELQILANCYLKQKDTAGYVATIEKLVTLYPKKEYWTDLLARVQKKPGFSDRLGVHVYRLRMATGNMKDTNDYFEMAQLAMQAGVPAEAKIILDKGYEAKALGVGKEAERHQRLRDLINKNLAESQKTRAADETAAQGAKDGDDLVKVGLNYVYEGNAGKGLPLIEQGIKKGGLRRPEDAKLLLGEAQLHAGQKQKAVATFREVKGTDGAADIARLWVLNARV